MLKIFLVFALLFSAQVLSHPGHDHASPFAWIEHLLWVVPIAIAAGIVFRINKTKSADKE